MNKETLKLLKKLDVLIVEDDKFLGKSLKDALSEYCDKVVLKTDGEQGLSCYYDENFNIVITDINLPKKNGLALAKEIKEHDKDALIVILTAYDSEHNIRTAIDISAFAFLHKPFELEQLYNTLLMAIGKIPAGEKFFDLGKGFRYIFKSRKLFYLEEEIHLTKTEANLLRALINNAGETTTQENIERSVWYDKQATPDTIRMYINKLRVKLYHELIQNVQGYGYRLAVPD